MKPTSLSGYFRIITDRYSNNHCGLDLSDFGDPSSEEEFEITDNQGYILDFLDYRKNLEGYEEFTRMVITYMDVRPFWIRINVVDHVINEYIGIGFLNRFSDWPDYMLKYLLTDETEQGGDSIFAIFDLDFEWVITMIMHQEEKVLKLKLYKK